MKVPMPPELAAVHVLTRLQEARARVARGWPSVALALAGNPITTAPGRLQEAEAARYADAPAPPWVQVLTDALAAVEEARAMWDGAPDTMPPAASGMPPCARDLRLHLADARACAAMGLAWEDPGGLSRPQALCVLHLAVCVAEWRAHEQRQESAVAKVRAELDSASRERAAAAARVIWAPQPKEREAAPGPRSLRDLASVSSAFDQWGEEDDS